jgi:hypothetical protein
MGVCVCVKKTMGSKEQEWVFEFFFNEISRRKRTEDTKQKWMEKEGGERWRF